MSPDRFGVQAVRGLVASFCLGHLFVGPMQPSGPPWQCLLRRPGHQRRLQRGKTVERPVPKHSEGVAVRVQYRPCVSQPGAEGTMAGAALHIDPQVPAGSTSR